MKPQLMTLGKIAITGLTLTCVACASSGQRPESELARAETTVELAEQNGAREFGPAALERAQDQLAKARVAAANEEYDRALKLAEKAELDAELALAQSNHEKALVALREIRESIEDLRREIARNQAS